MPTPISPAADGVASAPGGDDGARRRLIWIGGGVAALVLVLLGTLLATQLGEDDATEAGQTTGAGTDTEGSTGDDAKPDDPGGTDGSGETDDSGSGDVIEDSDTVSCWDGMSAAVVQDCPDLTGAAGIRWVFPTLDENFDSCRPARLYDGKLTAYYCRVELASGRLAALTFSEYGTADQTESHYVEKYGEPREGDERLVFGPSLIREGEYQASAIFADGRRWAVTAMARTPNQALASLNSAQVRSLSEMNDQVGPPPP